LARVKAGTILHRWHGWGRKETKLVGKRLVGLNAETGVDQWPVLTVDLRHLGLDDLILSV
jgi:hypothetical protein